MSNKKDKVVKIECIRCRGWKDTRQVPTESGFDPKLKHYVCDKCELGWYRYPGDTSRPNLVAGSMVPVNLETFKRMYVREGRPAIKPGGRR